MTVFALKCTVWRRVQSEYENEAERMSHYMQFQVLFSLFLVGKVAKILQTTVKMDLREKYYMRKVLGIYRKH